jgi:hypothetical protein
MPKSKHIHHRFGEEMSKYVMAGFGLVAGLAWNDAIRSFIEYAFPMNKGSIWAKFIYAFIMTALVVLVGWHLEKFFRREDEAAEAKAKK